MNAELRVGLVGCGAMGRGHLDVWQQTEGAKVTAVCDGVEELARKTGAERGVAAFVDLAAMCSSGLVDAVDICTPSGLHAGQGLVAAEHGLHVLVEKPLDLDLQKADRLIDACKARGVTLGCIFQRRTYRGAQIVAKAIHEGAFGKLLSCSAYVKWWRPQSYYDSGAWRGTWALDGGVLANQGIHAIDHLCWMAGRVVAVESAHIETANHTMEAEDHALAIVRFESGALGVIEATTCCNPPLCSRIEVFGTTGAASFDDANVVSFGTGGEDRLAECSEESGSIGGRSDPMAISMKGHADLAADFVAAVREGREPIVGGEQARMSLEALTLIYRAGGRSV